MANTLFHISDVHFGVENRAALAWFEEAVAQEKPDLVVCTGDLTQRATHEQFAAAKAWFEALGSPAIIIGGNHDLPYYNLAERFQHPFGRSKAVRALSRHAPELEHVAFVTFNTNARAQLRWPWSDGVVRQRKLDDALDQLARLRDDPRMTLVLCHHPLLPARDGEQNPTIGGDDAFAALGKAGADAVLSGHVHVPFDMERERGGNTMRMIGAGTLSTRLRGAVPSYNVVRIDGGTISVEQRDFTE